MLYYMMEFGDLVSGSSGVRGSQELGVTHTMGLMPETVGLCHCKKVSGSVAQLSGARGLQGRGCKGISTWLTGHIAVGLDREHPGGQGVWKESHSPRDYSLEAGEEERARRKLPGSFYEKRVVSAVSACICTPEKVRWGPVRSQPSANQEGRSSSRSGPASTSLWTCRTVRN